MGQGHSQGRALPLSGWVPAPSNGTAIAVVPQTALNCGHQGPVMDRLQLRILASPTKEDGCAGQADLTPLPLAEFQRGQYPDTVTRERLATATQLPDATIRVRGDPPHCHSPAGSMPGLILSPKASQSGHWAQGCPACQHGAGQGSLPGMQGHLQTVTLLLAVVAEVGTGSGGQCVWGGQGEVTPESRFHPQPGGLYPLMAGHRQERGKAGSVRTCRSLMLPPVCQGKARPGGAGPSGCSSAAAPVPSTLSETTHACAAQLRVAACPIPVQPPLRPCSWPLPSPALPCRGASAGPRRLWGHCWTPGWCHRAGVQGRSAAEPWHPPWHTPRHTLWHAPWQTPWHALWHIPWHAPWQAPWHGSLKHASRAHSVAPGRYPCVVGKPSQARGSPFPSQLQTIAGHLGAPGSDSSESSPLPGQGCLCTRSAHVVAMHTHLPYPVLEEYPGAQHVLAAR